MYLVFINDSWLAAWNFFSVESGKGVCCHVNEVNGKAWKDEGWLPVKSTVWLQGCNFPPPTPTSGEGEGLEVESIATGWWFSQSCLRHEASIKTPGDRVWRTSGGNTWKCGESVPSGGGGTWNLHASSHLPCPMHSLPSSCSWVTSLYSNSVTR